MHITPTKFIAKLLAAMQVLVTLDMPLTTTMALPVTSKPIESTVENLAWQAWIELPPEQKQQVKSRKVTPKSIFTLPLRVECPQGHKQVDTKCIPIAIGTNDVLIDLNALGLLVGTTQTEDLYDYDDMGEEMAKPMPFGSEMSIVEAETSGEGLKVELKSPAKDEPLKFNIFESKFNIFQEEPSEDYSSLSYEGLQSSEKEQNVIATTPPTTNASSVSTVNVTAINHLISEASNISQNNFELYKQQEKNSSLSDSHAEESKNFSALADDEDFNIDAISVPAFGFKLPQKHNESTVELVTAIMDTETTTTSDDRNKAPESDIQTLLQTESFLPLLNQTTATTLQNTTADQNFSLTTVPLQAASESSSDALSLNIDEEITTLPNVMDQDTELKNKQEYTRSISFNLTLKKDNEIVGDGNGNGEYNGDNEQVKDLTLESLTTNDEPLETTTPIQLDETTIIETHSYLSTTPSTQKELKALLLQQEQALEEFEKLQRKRKGQKDQHLVFKKSKVQPVEVLSTTTEATTKTKTTTDAVTTSAANLPAATKSEDDLISATAETVTPLLTVHNENNNNDRFYYQHFAIQDNVVTQRSGSKLKQKITTAAENEAESSTAVTTTKSSEIETIPLTSEIDLAEELRIINELVKGIRPTTTLTKMQTTTTTTTEKPTVTTLKTIIINDIRSTSSFNSPSESSSAALKPTLTTSQIWSRIMPFLNTSSTTPMPGSTTDESFNKSSQKELGETTSSSISLRSNRNSKIIRINDFNSISAATTAATPIILEDSTSSLTKSSSSSTTTTSSEQLISSTESSTYKPYWWLPLTWSVNKPTDSEEQPQDQESNIGN